MFGNLTERFICIVLEVLGQDLQFLIAEHRPVQQARKYRIVEKLIDSDLRSVFRAGRSVEACRQAWSWPPSEGDWGQHRTVPAAQSKPSLLLLPSAEMMGKL
jgi:hypothetical protein